MKKNIENRRRRLKLDTETLRTVTGGDEPLPIKKPKFSQSPDLCVPNVTILGCPISWNNCTL